MLARKPNTVASIVCGSFADEPPLISELRADQRAGKISKRVHARRHAVLARMLGTGIAWTWALLPRTGTSSKHSLRDLVDDAEQTLRASLRPPVRSP